MKYKFKSRDIVFYTPIQEMIMNESNHKKITKDTVWDHINNHILDEIKADVVTRALMVTKKKADC